MSGLSTELKSWNVERFTRNAYRVLGLPGTATLAAVNQAAEALLGAVSAPPPQTWDMPWLGPVPRAAGDITEALERLRNPSQRLLHRLFWFTADAPALAALTLDSLPGLASVWAASADLERQHDAALLYLIQAQVLDQQFRIETAWSQATEHWRRLLFSAAFWRRLAVSELESDFPTKASLQLIYDIRKITLELVVGGLTDTIELAGGDARHRGLMILQTLDISTDALPLISNIESPTLPESLLSLESLPSSPLEDPATTPTEDLIPMPTVEFTPAPVLQPALPITEDTTPPSAEASVPPADAATAPAIDDAAPAEDAVAAFVEDVSRPSDTAAPTTDTPMDATAPADAATADDPDSAAATAPENPTAAPAPFAPTQMLVSQVNAVASLLQDVKERLTADSPMWPSVEESRSRLQEAVVGNFEELCADILLDCVHESTEDAGASDAYARAMQRYEQMVKPQFQRLLALVGEESLLARRAWDTAAFCLHCLVTLWPWSDATSIEALADAAREHLPAESRMLQQLEAALPEPDVPVRVRSSWLRHRLPALAALLTAVVVLYFSLLLWRSAGPASLVDLEAGIQQHSALILQLKGERQLLRDELTRLETRIAAASTTVDSLEAKRRQGQTVDEEAYRKAQQDYATLVPKYNRKVMDYNRRTGEMKTLIADYDRLAARYNSKTQRKQRTDAVTAPEKLPLLPIGD